MGLVAGAPPLMVGLPQHLPDSVRPCERAHKVRVRILRKVYYLPFDTRLER